MHETIIRLDGSQTIVEVMATFGGGEYPVIGSPAADTIAVRQQQQLPQRRSRSRQRHRSFRERRRDNRVGNRVGTPVIRRIIGSAGLPRCLRKTCGFFFVRPKSPYDTPTPCSNYPAGSTDQQCLRYRHRAASVCFRSSVLPDSLQRSGLHLATKKCVNLFAHRRAR